MPNGFVEAGAASTVVALASDAGVPLVQTQKDLTPFQRLVLQKELKRRQDKIDEQRQGTGAGTAGGTPQIKNSKAQPGGGTGGMGAVQGETVEYINEGSTDG